MTLQDLTQEEIEHIESLDFYDFHINGEKPFKLMADLSGYNFYLELKHFSGYYEINGTRSLYVSASLSLTPYNYIENTGKFTPFDLEEYFTERRKKNKFKDLKKGDVIYANTKWFSIDHISQLTPVIMFEVLYDDDECICTQEDEEISIYLENAYLRSDFDENGYLIKNK